MEQTYHGRDEARPVHWARPGRAHLRTSAAELSRLSTDQKMQILVSVRNLISTEREL